MNQLYLASEIDKVANHIAADIGEPEKKRLAFIYTSYEYKTPEPKWLKQNRQGLIDAGFDLFDYTITGKTHEDFDRDLEDVDIIHLNGGDTKYLHKKIIVSGFDAWLRQKIESDIVITTSSAGGIVLGPTIPQFYSDDNKESGGISLVNFTILPHWGNASHQRKYLGELEKLYTKTSQPLVALTDNQYIKVVDDMCKIVNVRK